MAACATPGTGRPSCVTEAASPTTNTSGASGMSRKGLTNARPARSVAVPSILTGWVAYPPLSGLQFSPGVGVDYYDVVSWQPWLVVAAVGAVVILAGIVSQVIQLVWPASALALTITANVCALSTT